MMDVLGHFVIWLILIVCTVGIAALFWPYSLAKLILNSMVVDNRQVKCELSAGRQLGHMVLWAVLIVCTVGIAFPFYFFGIIRTAINSSRLE